MIFEHFVNGGWIGFETRYHKRLKRRIPMLWIGFREKPKDEKMKTDGLFLIHKNTEILPNLYKAIGHYLGHRKEENNAYFQHGQETSTGCFGENQQREQETYTE